MCEGSFTDVCGGGVSVDWGLLRHLVLHNLWLVGDSSNLVIIFIIHSDKRVSQTTKNIPYFIQLSKCHNLSNGSEFLIVKD